MANETLDQELTRVVGGHKNALKALFQRLGVTVSDGIKSDELKNLGGAAGQLPVQYGGTGGKTVKEAQTNLGLPTNASGALLVSNGGTGAITAEAARLNIGAAATSHTHDASNINSGTLPIVRGGTGATTAAQARTNLGAAAAVHTHAPAEAGVVIASDAEASAGTNDSKFMSPKKTVTTIDSVLTNGADVGSVFFVGSGYKPTIRKAVPCDGTAYSANAYADLFNRIGYESGMVSNTPTAVSLKINGVSATVYAVDDVLGTIVAACHVSNNLTIGFFNQSGSLLHTYPTGYSTSVSMSGAVAHNGFVKIVLNGNITLISTDNGVTFKTTGQQGVVDQTTLLNGRKFAGSMTQERYKSGENYRNIYRAIVTTTDANGNNPRTAQIDAVDTFYGISDYQDKAPRFVLNFNGGTCAYTAFYGSLYRVIDDGSTLSVTKIHTYNPLPTTEGEKTDRFHYDTITVLCGKGDTAYIPNGMVKNGVFIESTGLNPSGNTVFSLADRDIFLSGTSSKSVLNNTVYPFEVKGLAYPNNVVLGAYSGTVYTKGYKFTTSDWYFKVPTVDVPGTKAFIRTGK